MKSTRVDFDCGIVNDILLVTGGNGTTEIMDLSTPWILNEWNKGDFFTSERNICVMMHV